MGVPEEYCRAVRVMGWHGYWEPNRWIWPGDCGPIIDGVFRRETSLARRYRYQAPVRFGGPAEMDLVTTRVDSTQIQGAALFPTVLDALLSAGGSFTYATQGGGQLLMLLTQGTWWDVDDIQDVRELIKSNITVFDPSWVVVTRVLVTTGGVIGLTSTRTTGFTVAAKVGGPLSLEPIANASIGIGGGQEVSVNKVLQPRSPTLPDGQMPTSANAYTPIFSGAYGIRKRYGGRVGRPEFVSTDYKGAAARSAARLVNAVGHVLFRSRHYLTQAEVANVPADELLVEWTPELVDAESHGQAMLGR
jgi:hypothetical protein